MKRKMVSWALAVMLAVSTVLSGCGGAATGNGTPDGKTAESDGTAESETPDKTAGDTGEAESTDRVGARWIDSGLYGTFKDMDEIRLQDDFAAAINREWAENAKIGEGESDASARTEQTDRLNEEKLAVLAGEKKADDADLTSLQNFYQLLLDWEARNARGVDELRHYAEDIMAVRSVDEMTNYYSDPDRNLYGSPMLIDMVMGNSQDAFSNILTITSPVMISDDPDDYEEGGQESEDLAVKRQIGEYMLMRLGYSEDEAKDLFDKAIEFESHFVSGLKVMDERVEQEGMAALDNCFSVKEVEDKYRNLPICAIYRAWGFDLKDTICIHIPPMLEGYDANYTDENIEQIKAWTLVNTILKYTNYCDREAYEKTAKLNEPLTGTDSVKKDEVYALDTLNEVVPSMIDQMYINYCFDKEIKTQVEQLVDMMLSAYREMLEEEDWLSEETRTAAIDKLDHIKRFVCYPDNLPDIDSVTIKSAEEGETAFEAIKAAKIYARKVMADMLTRRNDGTYWRYDNYYSTLRACYVGSENSINIFAGICGGDYYDPDWPLEKKLGGLCMVVGHEITHAFDNLGAIYDKDGNLKNWWTDEDKMAFKKRVDKLDEYYSALVPAPQISDKPYGKEGAKRLDGEAIADLGSLKCLLSIAKKQDNFDYEMFFKQLAIIQKNVRYEAAEKVYIKTQEHPVECYRCNVPLSNYDEFLEAFDVKEGDGMYLAPDDRIRIW